MKILKKFLLSLSISIFIFLLVPRETFAQVYDEYIEYSSTYRTKIESKLDTINSVYEYIRDNLDYINGLGNIYLTRDDYLIIHPTYSFNCDSNSLYKVGLIYDDIVVSSYQLGFSYVELTFNCENNIPTTLNSIQTGSSSTTTSVSPSYIKDYAFFDYRLAFGTDLEFINNSTSYNFILRNTETTLSVPPSTSIGLEVFAQTLIGNSLPYEEPIECDNKTQVLGLLNNVKWFKFNVNGVSNVLQPALTGIFTIDYENDNILSSDNFYLVVVNNDENVNIEGRSYIECSDTSYQCKVYYAYNYTDDIDEVIDFSIEVHSVENGVMPKTMRLYYNTCAYNYVNVSYNYTNNTSGDNNNTNTSVENLLTDSSAPDLNVFSNLGSLLPPGPIDSILTLPLKMLNSILNALSGQCTPITLNLPYVNKNVTLNCINDFYNNIGASTFFNITGSIASTLMLLKYFMFLYNWIDNILRLGHNKVKAWGTGEV